MSQKREKKKTNISLQFRCTFCACWCVCACMYIHMHVTRLNCHIATMVLRCRLVPGALATDVTSCNASSTTLIVESLSVCASIQRCVCQALHCFALFSHGACGVRLTVHDLIANHLVAGFCVNIGVDIGSHFLECLLKLRKVNATLSLGFDTREDEIGLCGVELLCASHMRRCQDGNDERKRMGATPDVDLPMIPASRSNLTHLAESISSTLVRSPKLQN